MIRHVRQKHTCISCSKEPSATCSCNTPRCSPSETEQNIRLYPSSLGPKLDCQIQPSPPLRTDDDHIKSLIKYYRIRVFDYCPVLSEGRGKNFPNYDLERSDRSRLIHQGNPSVESMLFAICAISSLHQGQDPAAEAYFSREDTLVREATVKTYPLEYLLANILMVRVSSIVTGMVIRKSVSN